MQIKQITLRQAGIFHERAAGVPKALGSFEFGASGALERGIREQPEVRGDKLEEAQRIVGDPAYPPRETIQRIAALLAMALP